MIKFNHLWYLLHICCDFAILVNPFFRAVKASRCQDGQLNIVFNVTEWATIELSLHVQDYFIQFTPGQCSSPMTLYIAVFTIPIRRSNWPPHQGARLRLNFHCMSWDSKYPCNCSSLRTCFNHLAALTNVLPLSD